jgi:hypothetical protein
MELNNEYNTLVSMMQVGLDMAPTPTQIATWESDCTNLKRTRAAWVGLQPQIAALNSDLAKNSLTEIKSAPTRLIDTSCTFMPGPVRKARK